MALLEDIQNTYISYAGRQIDLRGETLKAITTFEIDINLQIKLKHNQTNRYFFTKYNQRRPIESTDDIRWILKKLYND